MKLTNVCVLLIGTLLSSRLIAEEATPPNILKPCLTMAGDISQVTERGYFLIDNLDEWAEIWQKHTGQLDVKYKGFNNHYDTFYDPLNLPLVDFERFMVIAIFNGSAVNCAGLRSDSMTVSEEQINFRFSRKSLQTQRTPQSKTVDQNQPKTVYPYGFFVIPRSETKVVLEEKVFSSEGVFEPGDRYKSLWKTRKEFSARVEKDSING